MTRHAASAMPYYRSQVTRAAFIVTGTAYAWAFLWGPSAWRNTPSLHWLYDHGLPELFITILSVVYVALHIAGRLALVAAGCALGMLLYGWELCGLLFTLDPDKPSNPLAIGAVILAIALHYASLRLVWIQMENDRRDNADGTGP